MTKRTDIMSNYSKLEQIKTVALQQLDKNGFKGKITDEQLNNVVFLLSMTSDELRQLKSEPTRINMLLNRLMVLWAKLMVEYNVDVRRLI